MSILLITFGSCALVAVITVATMRLLARKFNVTDLMDGGVRLTENGIEYLGFFFLKRKKAFAEIESVELNNYFGVVVSVLLLRYGFNGSKIPPKIFSDFVVIRLNRANQFEYLFFTPKNAADFVEQLKSRIQKT